MSKRKRKYIRKWLNPTGRAFVELEESSYENGFSLTVGDCSRRISLEFDYEKEDDESGRKKRLRKLDKFIAVLQEGRTLLDPQTREAK